MATGTAEPGKHPPAALPGGGDLGLSHLQLALAGIALAAAALTLAKLSRPASPAPFSA